MSIFTLLAFLTFVFMLAFTLVYLGKSLEKKPAFLTRMVDTITNHMDQVSLWGGGYGLLAALLTLLTVSNPTYMLICLASNILIVLMALPFVFDRAVDKFQAKANPAFIDEGRNLVGWVTRNEKYLAYVGVVCTVLLFTVVFH